MEQTGEQLDNVQIHELDQPVVDLQWSADRTYFITASRDKTAKVCIYETWNRLLLTLFPAH
jgi:hypothetical protein